MSALGRNRPVRPATADVWCGSAAGFGTAQAVAVGTTGGATVDTVPPTAGLLVEPGNVEALTRAPAAAMEAHRS